MHSLELVPDHIDAILTATESAAVAASAHVSGGDKEAVDAAAVRGMRAAFDRIDVDAVVVVGEGEKDEAPMLYAGERLGTGKGPALEIAVDPVDGTRLAAQGLPDAVAVLSVAARGSFFDPGPLYYMEKLVTSCQGAELSLRGSMRQNVWELARALAKPASDVRVAVQERPRNRCYIDAASEAGARVVLFRDGDVAAAIRAAHVDGDIDLLIGIGGAPEGVLTAAAVRALGGHMQARPAPQKPDEIVRVREAGISTQTVLGLAELVDGDGYLFLTAVTDGATLRGVHIGEGGITTDSWVIDPHHGVRRVTRRHDAVRSR